METQRVISSRNNARRQRAQKDVEKKKLQEKKDREMRDMVAKHKKVEKLGEDRE